MRLRTHNSSVFAVGEAPCFLRAVNDGESLTRVWMHVAVGESRVAAVLDTGGAYFILTPELARDAEWHIGAPFARERVRIRGITREGTLHRLDLTLVADSGESVTFDATAFVPELEEDDVWPLPSYLGWQGCLERVRLAIDPGDETVYFGPVGG